MKLNDKAFKHAKQLIKDGKVEVDSDWSEAQPSAQDENDFRESHSAEEFGAWYLGIDEKHEYGSLEERYDFPYGDYRKVHRSAIMAIKQRAGQYHYDEVGDAADDLATMIDEDDAD